MIPRISHAHTLLSQSESLTSVHGAQCLLHMEPVPSEKWPRAAVLQVVPGVLLQIP